MSEDHTAVNAIADGKSAGNEPPAEIQSVNSKKTGGNRTGKALFLLVCAALMFGVLAWVGQNQLNFWKSGLRNTKKGEAESMSPEKSGTSITKVGAATGKAPPILETPVPEVATTDGLRVIRGADGKVITDPQGRALSVDPNGNVKPVPAITTVQPVQSAQPGAPVAPPRSRFGGSLYVEETATTGTGGSAPQSGATTVRSAPTAFPTPTPTPTSASPFIPPAGLMGGAQGQAQAGMTTVATTMPNTRTPTAQAGFFPDQSLMLPKGRQLTCVLTTRIDDQLPGYTTCTLVNNIYSDNGKTLLLERGSELWGEYGTTGQVGVARIAVNWVRIKTPDGVTVDLSSLGTDALGGSGVPGHYNPRWIERIGTAILISLMKDVTTAILENQATKNSGTSISVAPPAQNTVGTAGSISEQVARETLRVRPNTTVAEGTRIAVYVQRDLDFRAVYELRRIAVNSAAR